MNKPVDCRIFEDQLDSLMDGSLPEEGLRQLRLHAASCRDCGILLELRDHLALPPLEELESQVPDDLLDSLWSGVEAGVAPSSGPESPGVRWLVPALAAASLILLLSTSFLFTELRSARAEVREMAAQVSEPGAGLAASPGGGPGAGIGVSAEGRADLIRRTADLARSGQPRGRALEYALAGQDRVHVSTLLDLLQGLPPQEVLFETSRLGALRGFAFRPSPEMREVLGVLQPFLAGLDRDNEIRAGDLAEWLRASGLPGDLALPKSTLVDLLS